MELVSNKFNDVFNKLWPHRLRGDWTESQLAFLLNAPTVLIILLIIVYPVLYSLYLAFHQVGMKELRSGDMPFVGLQNFATLFRDASFWNSLIHTIQFSFISVAAMLILGVMIALVLNEDVLLSRVSRVLMLLPWAVPPIVNALMWGFILNPKYGYLNKVLYALRLIPEFRMWKGDPDLALYCVIVINVWRVTPFCVLLLHAALKGIPEELYDACKVDGTTALQKFWYVTLPLLQPTIVVLLVLRTAFAFMVFDEILGLTFGGPGDATWVAAYYTYTQAFRNVDMGVGSASAYVLTVIIAIISFFYIKYLYRQIQY